MGIFACEMYHIYKVFTFSQSHGLLNENEFRFSAFPIQTFGPSCWDRSQ